MKAKQIIIEIGADRLSFTVGKTAEPYDVNSSISMAANLREAFDGVGLLEDRYEKALVMADSNIMLIPAEDCGEDDLTTMYRHTFSDFSASDIIVSTEMPDMSAIAVYTINKDVNTVLSDHFPNVEFSPLGLPVWREMFRHNFTGTSKRLHAYFHDQKMEVFCFQQNRFRFFNTFAVAHAHDALYYLLYTWKQLAMNVEYDEMNLIGETEHKEWLAEHLKQYLKRVQSAECRVHSS